MPIAHVNNLSISYAISGPESAPWLVLINGLADDSSTWSAQLPTFSSHYRILTYDNRGIGATSSPPGPYISSLLASDLHALLVLLEIKEFHLLGVSMGGMIAQSYALLYPNHNHPSSPTTPNPKILSLSLCCTYAAPSPFCTRMFLLWADVAMRMSVRDVMRDVLLWAFTVPFFLTRTEELAEVEEGMRGLDMSREAYLAQLNVIQKFDSRGELAGLRENGQGLGGLEGEKLMVLAGEEDILIPVVLSRELAEGVEGSVWRTTKGGHGCMWEFPSEFNATVLEFLQSVDAKES